MAQELEDLLIKVDSECGDLKGIDSAINALQNLANFSSNASKGASSIEGLGKGLSSISAFGKNKANIDKTVKDIEKLKGSLESLSAFTKDASKSIKQLESLGKALGSFADVGNNLKGINDVTKGIGQMVDILEKLSKVEKDSTKGIKNLRNLGDALHSFNGLDDNVKNLNDVSIALLNLAKATDSFKGKKDSDFEYITKLGSAISTFTNTLDGRKWASVGQATQGLSNLIQALKDTKNVDVGQIGLISEQLKKFNDSKLINNSDKITQNIDSLTKALTVLSASSNTVQSTMNKLVDGFAQADKGFYNVRSSIEAIAFDFNDALKPVQNSNLFTTLERFKKLNDSYKNVGGLGAGLGSLISALDMLDGRDLDTHGLTQILEYLKAIAHDKTVDEAVQQLEKLGNIAQPVASLVNSLKYTDFDENNNVLEKLGVALNKFYSLLPSNMEKFSYVFYAIRDLIDLSKDASISLPEDNIISQLGKSLEGFKGLDNIRYIENLVEGLKSLASWLHIMKGYNGGAGVVDVTPILEIGEALTKFDNMGNNLNSFKIMVNNLKGLMRLDPNNLIGVDVMLERIFDALNTIPDGKGDVLKGLGSSIRAIDKMQNIDPNKLNMIADALTKILDALGGIQGSNNNISIKLDSNGVANFQKVVNTSNKTWKEFVEQLKQDLEHVDISSMFNVEGSRHELERSLREIDKMIRQRQRTIEEQRAKMETSKQTRENYKESPIYQTQASKWARATLEAQQLEQLRQKIAVAIQEAPRFDNDAQAYRQIHNLREEYIRLEEVMKKITQNGSLEVDPSSKNGRVLEVIQDRMDAINNEIKETFSDLQNMETTEEGLSYRASEIANEWSRIADETERASQEMRNGIGEGFTKFGGALSGTGNKVLGSFGNLSKMFGTAVQNGTAKLSESTLASLQGVAGTLSTFATALGQVGAVISVITSLFQAWWKSMEKVQNTLVNFMKSLMQFSKNMLSKVVGSFNAVAGAVNKVASTVKSGAELVVSALRNVEKAGKTIISIFSKVGSAFAPAMKGIKAMLSAVTPSFVKTLASSNFQLSKILKQSHLLKGAIKTLTRYFSMLSRMLMRKSITAFLNSMKQAFEDMVLFEKNSNDAFLQLNYNVSIVFSALRRLANQVMAIFEPIINAVASPVESFLTGLQAMAENVAKFMAILTGQPYYLRAKKFYEDYGQSVEDTNKKVKNLTNGLDELNILNDTKNSDSGIKPEDMFEKVPVDGSFEGISIGIQDILDKIKDFLKNIDWEKLKEQARAFVKRLFEIINTILRDKEFWELLGKTVAEIVNYLFTIINEAVHDLDWKALGQAITTFLKNALESIDWALIRDTVVTLAKGLADMWNEIFADKQLWKDIGETVAHVINDVIVAYLDTFAWNFDFSNMADSVALAIKTALERIDWEQIRHAVDGWTQGITNVINTWAKDSQLWDDIGTTLKHLINDVFVNAFSDFANIDFSSLTDNLKSAIEKALEIDWDSFNTGMQNWATNLANVINGVFADEGFLAKITTSISAFGNSVLNALDTLVENIKAYDIGESISDALKEGLGNVDWNTAFTLPSDALNKLSDAIKGLLESIPEDFNLGTWLSEHLNLTLEGVDWDAIKKNVEDIGTQIANFINGLLANEQFWANLGSTVGEVINIPLNLILNPLANINTTQLVDSVKTAIKNALDKIDFEKTMGKLGNLTQKIIDAVDYALSKTNWQKIGKQIGRGISTYISKISPKAIAQTVFDAFVSLSDTMSGILAEMIAKEDFYKLGQVLVNGLYGAIGGLANLLTKNKAKFTKAMKQFVQGVTDFLAKNKQSIIKYLNMIIDGLSEVLRGFSKEKNALVSQLVGILKKTNLAELLGTIIGMAINTWAESFEVKQALSDAIFTHLPKLFANIFKTISWKTLAPVIARKVLQGIIYLLSKMATQAGLTAMGATIGTAAGPIGTIIGLIVGFIINQLLTYFGAFDWIEEKISGLFDGLFKGKSNKSEKVNLEDELQKQLDDALKDVNLDADVDVTPNYNIDDSELNWDDYFNKKKGGVIIDDPQFGSITASSIEVETLKPWKIETDEINADFLYLNEIFADVLHVAEIDGNMEGKDTKKKSNDDYLSGNDMTIGAGNLTKDPQEVILNGDDFLKKLAKLNADFLKQLSKVFFDALNETDNILDDFNNDLKDTLNKFTESFINAIKSFNWKNVGKEMAKGFNDNVDMSIDGIENFAEKFLSEDDMTILAKRIYKLRKGLENYLIKGTYNTFKKYIDKMRADIESLKLNAFKGFSDIVDEEMAKALRILRYYVEWMKEEFDDLKEHMLATFEGLSDKADKELASVLRKVRYYLEWIKEEFDNFDASLDLSADLSKLEEFKSSKIFDGISEGFKDELDKAYQYLVGWVDRAKLKVDEVFKRLNDYLNGDLKVEANASAEASASSEATSDLIDALHSLADKLDHVKCECNCCGNCNGCGNGNGGSNGGGTTSSGGSTGGRATSSGGKTTSIKDEPTPKSSSPSTSKGSSGTTSSGGSTGGSDSLTHTNGSDYFKLKHNGKDYALYVTLDGVRMRVGRDMPADIRKRLANGEGVFDLNGIPLSDFKGIKSSDGFDMGSDSSWRKKIKDLWGENGERGTNETVSDIDGSGKTTGVNTGAINGANKGILNDTTSKDMNDYYADNTNSASGGSLNNKLPVEEALEKGLDLGKVETNTKDNTSNNTPSTDSEKSSDEKDEEKKKKGAGVTKADVKSGEAWTYDSEGNETGHYDPSTGKWSGDNAYTRKQDKAEEKKKNSTQTTPDVKTGEIKDAQGNVVGHMDGAWGGKYWLGNKEVSKEEYEKAQKEKKANKGVSINTQTGEVTHGAPTNENTLVDKANVTADYMAERQRITKEATPYYSMVSHLYSKDKATYKDIYTKVSSAYSKLNTNQQTIDYYKKWANEVIKLTKDAGISPATISDNGIVTYGDEQNASKYATQPTAKTDTVTKDDANLSPLQRVLNAIPKLTGKDVDHVTVNTDMFGKNLDIPSYAKDGKNSITARRINELAKDPNQVKSFRLGEIPPLKGNDALTAFNNWYEKSFLVKGYKMGGTPQSGEIFVSRENGTPEFVGSFGNKTAVANNDQIVTAVANGVSMANDSLRTAIENQTNALESAINNKDLDVVIGDRQIAEANRRGQQGLGGQFVQ